MTAGKAFYAKQGKTYVIKLVGEIRYTMGCTLDQFIHQLFESVDFDDIVVDLTAATSIDSTSLGLLAKIANLMQDRFKKRTTLISTSQNINQLLDSLGLYEIFDVCDDRRPRGEANLQLPISDPSKAELTKTMFEAHTILSELNDKNRQTFKGVLVALKNKLLGRR
jgi:anti-anti-sigma factor